MFDTQTYSGLNDYVRDRTPLRGTVTGWYNRTWLNAGGVSAKSSVVEGPGDTMFLSEDFTEPCERSYEPEEMIDMFARWSDAADEGGKEWLFIVAPDKGAVLDHRLEGRSEVAARCSREVRTQFRQELDRTGVSLDLAAPLIEADKDDPGRWYYERDSHWTFEAGSLVAGLIVDDLQPGIWDASAVKPTQRTLTVRGDIIARLGIERTLDETVPGSLRTDVTTTSNETDIGGTRTIRTYSSSGSGAVVPGTTIIVHDSMMNFAEQQLAPYFERVVFIHWFDINKADFFARAGSADRVLLTRVERNVHITIENTLMGSFDGRFESALRGVMDEELSGELLEGASALREFNEDTGLFAQDFSDLLADPGVRGWAGPYLDDAVYRDGVHPRYGDWKTLQRDEVSEGTPADCREFHAGTCATWLLLLNVPESTIAQLDQEFDDGDGLQVGRVRRSLPHGILYFYSAP